MTSNAIRALFAAILLLCLLTAPVAAQDATPTDEPVATQAPIPTDAPEVSAPVENTDEETTAIDRIVRVVEILVVLIIALITSNVVALGAGGVAIGRLLFDIAGFLTSLTPTPLDDAAVKRGRAEFDARYPTTEQADALIDRRLTLHRAGPVDPVEPPHHEPGRNN